MFKRTITTAALLGALTLNVGCVDHIAGPERNVQAQSETPRTPAEPLELSAVGTEIPTLPPAPCARLVGDLTGDGRVDASDVSAFALRMRIDLYKDGIVNFKDEQLLYAVLRNTPIDMNGNGRVDASDYSVFAYAKKHADFNESGRVDAADVSWFAWAKGELDLNGDGQVTAADRAELERHLGEVSICA